MHKTRMRMNHTVHSSLSVEGIDAWTCTRSERSHSSLLSGHAINIAEELKLTHDLECFEIDVGVTEPCFGMT